MQNPLNITDRKIYTVTQLTENIKHLLEDNFPMVWISGETSNLRIPPSGHAYFTLKDSGCQISAVIFKGQIRQLKFDLDDGMNLIGLGRLSVYAPRGNYQVILEYAEPKGVGALQVVFEQLKTKLENEGLFLKQHKQALPHVPKRIGLITSPSGSVVQDILKVLKRRFNNLIIDIYPVRVQGFDATKEIVHAITFANRLKRNDILIIARGGGSIEDLSPFNSEEVARAIFSSHIPVVSAVGHETDYTIADFVSDLRAPTPSAAAEMIIPVKSDMRARIVDLEKRSARSILNKCIKLRDQQKQIARHIVHPGHMIQDMQVHVDNLVGRLIRALKAIIKERRSRCRRAGIDLVNNSPEHPIKIYQSKIEITLLKMSQLMQKKMKNIGGRLITAKAVLSAVSPSAILERGYSITRTLPDRKILMDSQEIEVGQLLEIQLAKGKIDVSAIKRDN